MKKALSPRDLELLSAYLDDQVQARDRQKVEARLREDADFRKSYEQMRQTRRILRSLPVVRAPRNFTLSPARARIPPMQRAIPAFGIVSALASFLLVLVFLGDLLFFSPRPQTVQSLQNASAPQALRSSPAEKSVAQDSALETATKAALANEAASGAQVAAPIGTPAPPSASAPLTSSLPQATSASPSLMVNAAPVTSTVTSTATSQILAFASQPTSTVSGEQGTAIPSTSEASVPHGPAPAPEQSSPRPPALLPWYRWVEIMLVLVALSAGLLFFLSRRALHR